MNSADLLAIHREICKRSLKGFVRTFWKTLEPTTPLAWGWALDAICAHNRLLVILGAGGRLEIDGVAQDRGQHHAGNLRVDPDASALVQIRQHGAGAADRHGAEKNGAVGGDIANLVVVNHGQQFGLGEVVRGLGQIVVIDQRNLLSRSVRHLLRC